MTTKRQTLDGMGVRIRPRTYLDQPRLTIRRQMVSDMLPNTVVPTNLSRVEEAFVHAESVSKSKQIVDSAGVMADNEPLQPVSRPLPEQESHDKPAESSKQNDSPTSICEIVQMIQDKSLSEMDAPNVFTRDSLKPLVRHLFGDRRSTVMSSLSAVLLVGGMIALVGSFVANRSVHDQVKAINEVASASIDNESLASDEGVPSEEPVPESVVLAHTTPADEPRYISIPKLRTKQTRVLKLGLDTKGAIKSPKTTWDTAWYEGSSKPGDKVGSTFIAGHVSGLTSGGVFYNLYRLVDGDEILVEMGDGTIYTYRVVAKEEVPLESIRMNKYLVSKDINKPGLTLMTCAGEYNPITQTYENRLAVFAVREP